MACASDDERVCCDDAEEKLVAGEFEAAGKFWAGIEVDVAAFVLKSGFPARVGFLLNCSKLLEGTVCKSTLRYLNNTSSSKLRLSLISGSL